MKIDIYKMNDLKIRFAVYDQDENVVNLNSADDIRFTVKTELGESKKVIDKVKSKGDISVSGEHDHVCEVNILKEDTEGLTAKEYIYELLVEVDGGRYTAVIDSFTIKDVVINV